MEPPPGRKRKSTLKACQRCHRRKQRCIGRPVCANCQAANTECVRDCSQQEARRFGAFSRQELIDKIETLQSQLPNSNKDVTPGEGSHEWTHDRAASIGGDLYSQPTIEPEPPSLLTPRMEEGAEARRGLSSEDGRRSSPSKAPEESVWDQSVSHLVSRRRLELLQMERTRPEKAHPPDHEVGMQLISTYLRTLHRRAPFLDSFEILDLHNRRHELTETSVQSKYHGFKLFMVYAIGGELMQPGKMDDLTLPDHYFASALLLKPVLEEMDPIQAIEAIVLILCYNLRHSLSSHVWYLVGLVIRTAVDVGLHREQYYERLGPKTADRLRCLFWTTYGIERDICWALKRPFSISDSNIDTQLHQGNSGWLTSIPSGIELQNTSINEEPPNGEPCVIAFVARARLQRIMSHIYQEIHRVDKPVEETKAKLPGLLAQLREFEDVLAITVKQDRNWVQMHYANSIRQLIDPFLGLLEPHDELMKVCLKFSGQMCQSANRLRTENMGAFSFLVVNHCFIAGITMCYVLYQCPSLWTTTVANDLRACSSSLAVMADRNHALRKYRDVLESIIGSTMEHIDQAMKLGAREKCLCANCSPKIRRNGKTGLSFEALEGAWKELGFEFPSQSYPTYSGTPWQSQDIGAGYMSPQAAPTIGGGNATPVQPRHFQALPPSFSGFQTNLPDEFSLLNEWDFSNIYARPLDYLMGEGVGMQ